MKEEEGGKETKVCTITRDGVRDEGCFWSESDRNDCLTVTATYIDIMDGREREKEEERKERGKRE